MSCCLHLQFVRTADLCDLWAKSHKAPNLSAASHASPCLTRPVTIVQVLTCGPRTSVENESITRYKMLSMEVINRVNAPTVSLSTSNDTHVVSAFQLELQILIFTSVLFFHVVLLLTISPPSKERRDTAIKAPHLAVCFKSSPLLFRSSQNKEEIQEVVALPFFCFLGFPFQIQTRQLRFWQPASTLCFLQNRNSRFIQCCVRKIHDQSLDRIRHFLVS